MDKGKLLKRILAILVVVLISIISFVGIFVRDKNRYKNIIPEYQLGMDLEGSRIINLKVDDSTETKSYDKDGNLVEDEDSTTADTGAEETTEGENTEDEITTVEEPINKPEILTLDNYNTSKNIIEKRLDSLGVVEYTVRQNTSDGLITVQVPENDDTDIIVSTLSSMGKFEIVDAETEEVLMDNSRLKSVDAGLAQTATTSGTAYYVVAITFNFDKEGRAIFKDITKNYTTTTDEEGNSVEKQIEVKIDDETLTTISFEEDESRDVLQLTMGNESSTNDQLTEYLQQAGSFVATLNNGQMPISYVLDNEIYEASDITVNDIRNVLIVIGVIFAILLIIMIIKFKKYGLLQIFTNIGFIATLLLIIRLTNVILTIEGIATIILMVILNYVFIWSVLKGYKVDQSRKVFDDVMLKSIIIIIPLAIVTIVFTFSSWLPLASCGMVGIWAIMIWLAYSYVITKILTNR